MEDIECVVYVNVFLSFVSVKKGTIMNKQEWIKLVLENEFNLTTICAMFNACTENEWKKAKDEMIEKENLEFLGNILQMAWDNAPDKQWIHDLKGWHILCDLCSDFIFGEIE